MSETIKKVEELDLNDILPNRFQPRIKFNEEKIFELSQSIKEHGVLQPIIVRPIGDKYEIVTGERRYKASVLAGLKTIPSIILNLEDKDSIELALIENVQREDLSPIEEAISYKKILDMGYLTQEELADKLGISQSAIANKKRLLNLCDEVQEALMEKEISERHARSLLKISNLDVQRDMLYRIISEKMTVRQLDVEISKVLDDPNYKNEPVNTQEETNPIENKTEEENKDFTSEKVESSDEKEEVENDINFDDILSNIISFKDEEKDKEQEENDEEHKSVVVNDIELEKDSDKDDSKISLVEESENKEETGENDTMNNMLNLNEDMNYNSLKNSSNTSTGKFIGISVDDDDEQKEEKKPVVENKSFFDFSSGTVRDDANNNVTVTRNTDYNDDNSALSSNSDIFGKKMSDLLSPQGSTSSIDNDLVKEQNAIFGSTTEQKPIFEKENTLEEKPTEQSSIFANLMKTEDNSTNNIDNDSLQSFLDPSFINGTKDESAVNNDSQINDSIFSKFIDEDFGGEVTSNVSDDSNDLLASTLFGNNKDKMVESNNNMELPELSNEIPSILEKPEENETNVSSIFEQSPSIKIDSEKIDLTDLSNSSSQTELISGLMDSSKKPDLLAPMGGNKNENVDNNPSSFGLFNVEESEKEEQKEETKEENTEKIELDVPTENNDLTPDATIDTSDSESDSEPVSISEPIEKPVFITASNDDINLSAPTTPIITDTKMSNLLSVEPVEKIDSDVSETESVETTELNQAVIDSKEEVTDEPTPITNNNIDVQPIIITDYNKQYDPVLPQIEEQKGPTIEFKTILKMIRDLSNQIENYGYKIDTDEIDLDDSYQVIFNIDKK